MKNLLLLLISFSNHMDFERFISVAVSVGGGVFFRFVLLGFLVSFSHEK